MRAHYMLMYVKSFVCNVFFCQTPVMGILINPIPLSGKGQEQCAAASLACLLCIQLGSGVESEEVFKTLKPIFKNILLDGAANIQTRQAVSIYLEPVI